MYGASASHSYSGPADSSPLPLKEPQSAASAGPSGDSHVQAHRDDVCILPGNILWCWVTLTSRGYRFLAWGWGVVIWIEDKVTGSPKLRPGQGEAGRQGLGQAPEHYLAAAWRWQCPLVDPWLSPSHLSPSFRMSIYVEDFISPPSLLKNNMTADVMPLRFLPDF